MQKTPRVATLLLLITFASHSLWVDSGQEVIGQEKNTTRNLAQKNFVEKDTRKKKPVNLPGLVVDFENKCVDLEATICLDKGFLELLACSKGSKEHESIVSISARPIHIHTALLLLGAKNGHPAIRKRIGKENPRWVDLPPRGDPFQIFFVIAKTEKKPIERPVNDFVEFSKEAAGSPNQDAINKTISETNNKPTKTRTRFPENFLFVGSQLEDTGKGPRQYLAEKSGNVISISTFGDEVLCLPEVQSHENSSLLWRIKPDTLPKVGTKIVLRLRPLNKPNPIKTKKPNSETPSK